ncbi:MAG TPA: long-chain-fatty-acid--CoA ligase [Micropepsaceae bacterium]|nr:long-chain-fatty-acid--CoA ligase [Micropepsaceae bacterium]
MFDLSAIRTCADLTRSQAKVRPNDIAMVFETRATSFGELDARASQVANGLIQLGVKPQARIGYIGMNSDWFFEVVTGCFKSNTVLVGVNWRLAGPEVVYVLNDAHAEVMFVGAEFVPLIEAIKGELKTVKHFIAVDGGHASWPSYAEWRDRQSRTDPMVSTKGSDDVIQLYTSGTTGHPKGVQLTNDNYIAFFAMAEKAGWALYDAGAPNLVAMPNFHVAGVNAGLVSIGQGACGVVMKMVDPVKVLDVIEKYRIRDMFLVPAVIQFLIQVPGLEKRDLSSLKRVFYGASPIAEETLVTAQRLLKCDFLQLYGLTETVGAGTMLAPPDHVGHRLRSCGKPYPGFDIRVVDENGKDVKTGSVGEIIMRSPTIMKGYWNKPEATAKSIVNGWFHTGDAGFFDEDGFLFIYDRVKDMIVSGGENIYPAEVENALMAHPAIADAAVIGVPDEKWGEAVKGVVVLKKDAKADPAEIINFCRSKIAGYKCPKSIDFIAALPRNPSGKILRRELREPYWAGKARRVN